MSEQIEFLSAVLIVSRDPERLAKFYRDVLGMAIREERHGDTEVHYGCELGDVHFAIHPEENFAPAAERPPGTVHLAFAVFDVQAFAERAQSKGAPLLYAPRDVGFAKMTALRDPDGNYLEFTELASSWFQHLERRRSAGHDMLSRWKLRK